MLSSRNPVTQEVEQGALEREGREELLSVLGDEDLLLELDALVAASSPM